MNDPFPGFFVFILGESFDRQASFRRTLSNSDSLSRRSRKLSRRKTESNLQDDATSKASVSVDLPGQFSTVGRPASSCSSSRRQKNKEEEVEEGGDMIRTEQLSSRRIRAPKGEGMSSLMATLLTSPRIERQPTAEIQTELSPTFNFSSDSDPYQMISASSSYCQVCLEGIIAHKRRNSKIKILKLYLLFSSPVMGSTRFP